MRNISLNTTIEIGVRIEGSGDPGYEPYETQNHDDPRFSDPGYEPEIDEFKVFVGSLDITDHLDQDTLNFIEETLIEKMLEDKAEDESDFDTRDYDEEDDG